MKTDGSVIFLFYRDVGPRRFRLLPQADLLSILCTGLGVSAVKLSLLDAYLRNSRRSLVGEYKQILQGALKTWSLILSAS